MAQITAAAQRGKFALWSLVLVGVGLLSILPLTVLNSNTTGTTGPGAAPVALSFDRNRVAYFEFSIRGDTLWLADPASPSERVSALTIPHAPDYGVVPSLSADRRGVAYNVLPADTRAPGPDAPAQLWSVSLLDLKPVLIASDVDLLVPATWSPDGTTLVFRRSNGEVAQLVAIPAKGGSERSLVESTDGLFPVGFSSDGANLLCTGLSDAGTVLYEVSLDGGDVRAIGILSDGLTRDWSLAPDATRIAYLEMGVDGPFTSASAFIFDLATGERTLFGAEEAVAFSPRFMDDGSLVIGQLKSTSGSTSAIVISNEGTTPLTPPARGFDVPLEALTTAGTAVTSFDGTSVVNPGRATLVVVDPQGVRREIASGEVTFLGWITP